ncbi:MAG: permease-like cell division protein FtsX [Bacteroidota bacterium]|nr:permease-like cell division protein FtsX [Bacteroidota bacterium]
MPKSEYKYNKRRLRSSYLTTVVSITLVLFMLGLLGLIVLHANKISTHVKENIGFSITMNNNIKKADIVRLQKTLDISDFVKNTKYITKEEAADDLKQELGEDFIGFLGYNPLLPSIDVKLNALYANSDSLRVIEKRLLQNSEIKKIYYQESLVNLVNNNIKKISLMLFGFSILLLLIALALINNTIRLSVYSKRFIIKTMQLVGATQGFIRRPFIGKGIIQGLLSSLISVLFLAVIMFLAEKEVPELIDLRNYSMYGILSGGIIFTGLTLSWISTYFAVNKYLKMENDKLFQ